MALISALAAATSLSVLPSQASAATQSPVPLINPASGSFGCIQPPNFEKDV
jgi:hypothetical protein